MSPDLERRLVETYPKLFSGYGAPPDKLPMAFGFECDDGWFDLLDSLCAQLTMLKSGAEDSEPLPLTALQVKEKYGTVRFYLGACTAEALILVDFAEAMSAKICEACGTGAAHVEQRGSRHSAMPVHVSRATQIPRVEGL